MVRICGTFTRRQGHRVGRTPRGGGSRWHLSDLRGCAKCQGFDDDEISDTLASTIEVGIGGKSGEIFAEA